MTTVQGPTLGLAIDAGGARKGARDWDRATDRVSKSAKEASRDADKLNRSLRGVTEGLGRASGALNPLTGFTIASIVATTTGAVSKLIAEVDEYGRSQRQLNQLIETTGGAAGRSFEQIDRFARELGQATLASADNVRRAAGQLLTFRSISGDVFDETLRLAQDLAATGFGTLQSATVQLAKALEDPARGLSALTRVGVSFSRQQQDVIKQLAATGQTAQAQRAILEQVAAQVGGAGRAEAEGSVAGAWDSLVESIDEFIDTSPEVGSAADLIARGLNAVAAAIPKARTELEKLNDEVERMNTRSAANLMTAAVDAEERAELIAARDAARAAAIADDPKRLQARLRAFGPFGPFPSIGEAGFTGSPERPSSTMEATTARREERFRREAATRRTTEATKASAAALRDLDAAVRDATGSGSEFSKILEEVETDMAAARDVIDSTRTPSERLAIEIRRLDDLYAKGLIPLEAYERATAKLKGELDDTGAAFDTFARTVEDSAEIALGSLVEFATGADVSLKSVARSILRLFGGRAINAGLGSLFGGSPSGGSGTGGIIGGLLGGLFGGGGSSGSSFLPGVGPGGLGFLSFGGPRQHGGAVFPGSAHRIEETGGEFFAPLVGGRMVPMPRARRAMAQSTDAPIVQDVYSPTIIVNVTGDVGMAVEERVQRATPRIVRASMDAYDERRERRGEKRK